jgi:ubiquinone/menaquinone biosynthesis C-methylase UbiE
MTASDPGPASTPGEVYERDMVPAMFAHWVRPLLELVGPREGERLLDVACGTGVVARRAVEMVGAPGRVVGLDMNASMLAVARTLGPGVEWREGNALALPFEDGSFDVVVCQQGAQYFADPGAGIEEMRRVLAPGGRVGVVTWASIEQNVGNHAIFTALERQLGPDVARYVAQPFALGDADVLRGLFEAAGFHDLSIRAERRLAHFPSVDTFTRGVLTGGALARAGITLTPDVLDTVVRDVERDLDAYVQGDGLRYPMESHLVLGRA